MTVSLHGLAELLFVTGRVFRFDTRRRSRNAQFDLESVFFVVDPLIIIQEIFLRPSS